MHKKLEVTHQSRVHCFKNPVIAVRYMVEIDKKKNQAYVHVHISFQRTGSINIYMINAMDKVCLCVRPYKKGRGNEKNIYAIKMNQDRFN